VTSVATAPDGHLTRRTRALVLAAGAALTLGSLAPGSAPAGAQLFPTTTEPPPTTTEPVPETTAPPETTTTTEAPPETTAPTTTTTTAPPTTSPPVTRASTTTTTAPPETTTTTAPPSAPETVPVTTLPVEEGRTRITQDTPDLGGVLTLWVLGILGTLAVLGWGWWRNGA
jgi:hypothetical protein